MNLFRERNGRVNLNIILCSSEGSLGFVVEAKLERPSHPKALGPGQRLLRQLHDLYSMR